MNGSGSSSVDVRCEVVGSLGTVSVENPALTPISHSGQRSNHVPADWRIRFGAVASFANGVRTPVGLVLGRPARAPAPGRHVRGIQQVCPIREDGIGSGALSICTARAPDAVLTVRM